MTLVDSTYVRNQLVGGVLVARLKTEQLTQRETDPLIADLSADGPASGWKVAVDCAQVEFIASAGIGALVTVCRTCKEKKGGFALFNVSDEIEQLVKVMQLHKLFKMAKDESAAVKALK